MNVRKPALAGTWYPADPAELAAAVDGYLADPGADPPPAGSPVVLIVPHAGFAYSGVTAGRGWARLKRGPTDWDRVVLLAPNHREPLVRLSVAGYDAYATPLGEVAVDVAGREALLASPAFVCGTAAHAREHAEEIQLPFLQRLFPTPPPVLPILVPRLDDPLRVEAAAALAPWCDGRTLFVVSTDLTHYGAAFGYLPFTADVPARLAQLDGGALDALRAWDAAALLAHRAATGITMCGLDAAALAISLPWPRRPRVEDLGYARSADRDGDFSHSVSYAAQLAVLGKDAP